MILAPFVGIIKLKQKKKLEIKAEIGETITVPHGQPWEIHGAAVNLGTFTVYGYLIE